MDHRVVRHAAAQVGLVEQHICVRSVLMFVYHVIQDNKMCIHIFLVCIVVMQVGVERFAVPLRTSMLNGLSSCLSWWALRWTSMQRVAASSSPRTPKVRGMHLSHELSMRHRCLRLEKPTL